MALIGLDIGHGNNTFPPSKGVYKNGKGYAEHDFNSKLGKRIKQLLEENGHTVILGQQPNARDVALRTRTNLYNRKNVDLVVSIHANANASSGVNGRCVFYWHSSASGKKLAQSIINEFKAKGYSTHGNGLHASIVGSWTNLHITRETKAPAVLIEHGFMTGSQDFDLIFGNKQAEYIEDMAQADVAGIIKYLGGKPVAPSKPSKAAPTPKPKSPKPKKQAKSIALMADEVIAGKHGQGHSNRRNSLGVTQAEYEKVRAEVNRRARVGDPTPSKPVKKSVERMVDEIIANRHGNGHENRRKSLGISASEYVKVRAEVNRRAGVGYRPVTSIEQMAREVVDGKHGNGHANRQRSLGVDNATYQKVRARVNQIM